MFFSILLLAHAIAVFAEPFHFFSRSPVRSAAVDARWIRAGLAPYVDFCFLSHGYFFFAPNPGPNHLIRCEIMPNSMNGNASPDRILLDFPDRRRHWPRLLYHRYFMLAEFYNNMFAPINPPPEASKDPRVRSDWESDRHRFKQLQTDIVRNLQAQYPSATIQLYRVAHFQPSEEQYFQERWKLTDPRLYEILPDTELVPPDGKIPAGENRIERDPRADGMRGFDEVEAIPLGVPQGSGER